MAESAAVQFARLFKLTPVEAVAYLQGRGQLTPTFDWRDLWHAEHAQQFTVSRLARLDLLEAIQAGITESVNGDLSRRDFMRDMQGLLQKAGWWGEKTVLDPVSGEAVTTRFDPPRLKLIFDTNTSMAYSAGLWERVERNKFTHPYIRYITKRDERVRQAHRAWDNLCLPVDDPTWDTHLPPNGWRCRCWFTSVSQAEYDAGRSPTGEPLNKTAPPVVMREWLNKRTGEYQQVPVGIDPGFDFNPGKAKARAANWAQVVTEKLAAAPAALAQAAKSAGMFSVGIAAGSIGAELIGAEKLAKLAGDAKAWVVGQGKATGTEYLQAYDASTGRVVASHWSGMEDSVSIPPELQELLDDRSVTLHLHHNHPDSVSLSLADLAFLPRSGVREVVAHGHDGSVFHASRGAEAGWLAKVLSAGNTEMTRQIGLAARRGLKLPGLDAHIFNQALHQSGLISYDYSLNTVRAEIVATEGPAINRIIQAVCDAITRAKKS